MEVHNLAQGSTEWHAHRRNHFNASDAPAMMGCSPYKTRDELIAEMATGIAAEVDSATQARFDAGHRFEELARPLAEKIIGEELYPVVGSEGRLSASFDGLTMAEDAAFEHKSLNDELRGCMRDQGNGFDLPLHYQVQMEQQLMVSGAERVLFMASKWERETLVEELHCWYASDPALRARIVAGWEQFHKDVAAFAPPEPKAAPVVAAPMETLPAVSVRVEGQLAIVSNLPAFGMALRNFIDRIPVSPSTDQEFADTEAACKSLKNVEDALEASENNALAQLTDVDTMRRLVADYRALARSTRLQREKLVMQRKEQLRGEIVAGGISAFRDHIAALNTRLGKPYMPAVPADFAGAVKGKRTVDSLRDGVNTELARAKITANEIADRIQINLGTLRELASAHTFLFADTAQIVLKATDDLAVLVKSRTAEHQAAELAKEEATRQRIRAEEQTKAEREARALLESEQQAQAKLAAEAATTTAQQAQAAIVSVASAAEPVQAIANVVPMRAAPALAPAIPAQASTPPSLKLGQIAERLAPIGITADGLASLGFKHAANAGASKLYHEADFPLICAALVRHILAVQSKAAA